MLIISLLAVLIVATVAIAARQSKKAARNLSERLEKARLIRHADQEHALVKQGILAGWYGGYMPPPELRGVGLW